jgi:hypothetical protein
MPKKTFTAGEVLAAADVNTFLMDQSVMTFADSGARGSAIGTATEGMLTYLNDSDTYQSWNGTAWVGVGGGAATNAIINGAFEINQRNFSSSTASGYGFDRWLLATSNGTVTYSAQTFTLGTAPVSGYEGQNFARVQTTGQTLTSALSIFRQYIESVRTFAGQTVTVSFFAKAASGTPKIAVELAQEFGTGGSPSAGVNNLAGQVTLSTSWQRYSLTIQLPSIAGKTIGTAKDDYLATNFWLSGGSNFDARTGSLGIQSNTFDIWGVQLEAGSTATPFRRNANSLQGELAACQRYYWRNTPVPGGNFFNYYSTALAHSSAAAQGQVLFPVPMRTTPTSVDFLSLTLYDGVNFSPITALTINGPTPGQFGSLVNLTSSGLTSFRSYSVLANSTGTSHLGFSAEL